MADVEAIFLYKNVLNTSQNAVIDEYIFTEADLMIDDSIFFGDVLVYNVRDQQQKYGWY